MSEQSVVHKDSWLSDIIKKNVFNLLCDDTTNLPSLLEALERPCMLSAKIPADDYHRLVRYQKQGFTLVDCNIQLIRSQAPFTADPCHHIVHACESDKEALYQLALTSFEQNRFHRDSNIDNEIASKIKALWVTNFFSGRRGTYLLVAKHKQEINGFLQVLSKNKEMLIDLIAIKDGFRSQGIAASLITFAYQRLFNNQGRVYVGTQLGNFPSIKLYQKLGFQLSSASYILHKHLE